MQMAYSKMKLQKKMLLILTCISRRKLNLIRSWSKILSSIALTVRLYLFIYLFFFWGGDNFLKNNPLQHRLKTTICETGACALNQIQNTLLHKNMILKRFLHYSCALLCCWREKSCSVLSGGRWEELQYSAKKPAWIWAPLFYFSKSWTAQLT